MIRIAIFAVFMAGCAASSVATFGSFDEPPASREEFVQKLSSLDELCGKKDAAKCHELGELLASVGDTETAVRAWDFACASFSYLPSCMRLAGAFESGFGVATDLDKAADIYRRACFLGLNEACKKMPK